MSIKQQPYCAIIILKRESGDRENVVYDLYIKEKLKSEKSHSQEIENIEGYGGKDEKKKKPFFVTFYDM